MDWLTLAVASMVFLSLSNLFVKLVVTSNSFAKLDPNDFLLPGVLIAAGVAIALYSFWQKTQTPLSYYPIGIAIFASLGVIAMILALQRGKVALVTAVLSLSTILVAVLSFAFLGDRFSGREIAAMVLALMSLLMLVV
ncbi:EamA family transporter [Candidatus Micrarchaeota archaeon]|nr:EamA family transporter [Candidatus Micrarchaeota archaeon]